LLAAVAIWFWTSAEWAAATKVLEKELQSEGVSLHPSTSLWLTLIPQLVSGAFCHLIAMSRGVNLNEGTLWRTPGEGLGRQAWHTAGAAYYFGQLLTVEALSLGAPSVAFTVKAIEPLTTATLAIPTLGKSWQPRLFAAIAVSCGGIVLTVWSSHGGHMGDGSSASLAVLFALLANLGFSCRACIVKKAFEHGERDPLEAFGRVTTTGALHGVALLGAWMALRLALAVPSGAQVEGVCQSMAARPGTWAIMSVTYFLYQCSSLLILDCIQVESHALLVATKHIFVVILASLLTGATLGLTSMIGVGIASVGVLLYTTSPGQPATAEKVPARPEKQPPVTAPTEKSGLVSREPSAELPRVLHCAVFLVAALGCTSPGLGL
jgi:drug/metabolite transporter (DMT)-like permease